MINSVDAVNFEKKHASRMLEIRDARVPATSVDAESLRSKGSLFEKVYPFLVLKVCRAPVLFLSLARGMFSM